MHDCFQVPGWVQVAFAAAIVIPITGLFIYCTIQDWREDRKLSNEELYWKYHP